MLLTRNYDVGIKTLAAYITQGFFKVSQNSLAVVGLLVTVVLTLLLVRPDLREFGESELAQFLIDRKNDAIGMVIHANAVERSTAVNPKELPKQQAHLTQWLSKKYRVAPEPVGALVKHAWDIGKYTNIEPSLILAVMAIESGFNPFAQSPVGAQGLMQVMTSVHSDKYKNFGGDMAAFDPLTNMKVGVKVLRDCIDRAGNVEEGLRLYVGTSSGDDGGYTLKVLQEQDRIRQVLSGKNLPINA